MSTIFPLKNTQKPIFIVGAPRTGSTAMANAIASTLGISFHGESHIWPILYYLKQVRKKYTEGIKTNFNGNTNFALHNLNHDNLDDHITEFFQNYHSRFGERYIDKTPGIEMMRVAPDLIDIYPNATFILTKRHPIDYAQSFMRKFPDTPFAVMCEAWKTIYELWLELKRTHTFNFVEVDQNELYYSPKLETNKISFCLQLTSHQCRELFLHITSRRDYEQTEIKSGQKIISLSNTGWEDHKKLLFYKICGQIAEEMGYSIFNETLFDCKSGSLNLFFPRCPTKNVQILNSNEYCYPLFQGYQITPNRNGEPSVGLIYRDLKKNQEHKKLLMSIRKEFNFGPDIIISVHVCDRDSEKNSYTYDFILDHSNMTTFTCDIAEMTTNFDIKMFFDTLDSLTSDYSSLYMLSATVE